MNEVLYSAATGTPGTVYAIFKNSEGTTICTLIDELKLFAGAEPVEPSTASETPTPEEAPIQ
jgi:hypothetical protein